MLNKTQFRNLMANIITIFLNGLLTLLPLTLTIALFRISIRLMNNWLFIPLQEMVAHTFLGTIPYSEIVLAIGSIFLFGIILKVFILRSLVHAIESLIFKIPLVRPVYSGMKQLVQAFNVQDKLTFKKVVMVEFPRTGVFSVGFLTSELPESILPNITEKHFNVFIPTTPNPTSGFFVIIPEKEIRPINLTRQEAMAMIISGGIIQPERFAEK